MTPLAVYIHWPFCLAKCPYCDFNSHVRERVDFERWQAALLSELQYMHSQAPDRTVTSIFFGGGTPSLMPPATVQALIERVHDLWLVANDIEITLEANPTSVGADTFPNFKAAGINRVSLGVQSFDDRELAFLGRGHSAAEARRAIGLAQTYFDRYSFDLIYARPNQTVANWQGELTEALALARGHLSLYQLTIEENTAFHHAYQNGGFSLPDDDTAEALYRLTEELTAASGLMAYEVSNYARPGEESRHNLSYWRGDDYIGVGPGAHGRMMLDASAARIATSTLKSPERWLSQVEDKGHALEVWQEIDPRVALEERLMMGLRLTKGIEDAAFLELISASKRELFIREGLLAPLPGRLKTTMKGRLLLNRLTAELIA